MKSFNPHVNVVFPGNAELASFAMIRSAFAVLRQAQHPATEAQTCCVSISVKINTHSELFNRENHWLIIGQIFTLQNAR